MEKTMKLYFKEQCMRGDKYSDFCGGILFLTDPRELSKRMKELRKDSALISIDDLTAENVDEYQDLLLMLMEAVWDKRLKMRMMYRPNKYYVNPVTGVATDDEQADLWYLFVANMFGLADAKFENPVHLKIITDSIPTNGIQKAVINEKILSINTNADFAGKVTLPGGIQSVGQQDRLVYSIFSLLMDVADYAINGRVRTSISSKNREKEKLYVCLRDNLREKIPYFNFGTPMGGTWSPAEQKFDSTPERPEIRQLREDEFRIGVYGWYNREDNRH